MKILLNVELYCEDILPKVILFKILLSVTGYYKNIGKRKLYCENVLLGMNCTMEVLLNAKRQYEHIAKREIILKSVSPDSTFSYMYISQPVSV